MVILLADIFLYKHCCAVPHSVYHVMCTCASAMVCFSAELHNARHHFTQATFSASSPQAPMARMRRL